MISAYHAKYCAHELARRYAADGVDRLSQSLFDARVDLSPHQIGVALFALRKLLDFNSYAIASTFVAVCGRLQGLLAEGKTEDDSSELVGQLIALLQQRL